MSSSHCLLPETSCVRQDRPPVLFTLAITRRDPLVSEINILNSQARHYMTLKPEP